MSHQSKLFNGFFILYVNKRNLMKKKFILIIIFFRKVDESLSRHNQIFFKINCTTSIKTLQFSIPIKIFKIEMCCRIYTNLINMIALSNYLIAFIDSCLANKQSYYPQTVTRGCSSTFKHLSSEED